MALSTSAAALATGKRISTPPAAAAAVAAAASGAGGGVPKDSAASVEVLTLEQQEQLAEDVNELFRVRGAFVFTNRSLDVSFRTCPVVVVVVDVIVIVFVIVIDIAVLFLLLLFFPSA